MSRMHKAQRALQALPAGRAQPWYYKPLLWFYRWPYRWWRKFRSDLMPVLVIQGGRWNMNRYVDRKAAERGQPRLMKDGDPAFEFGPVRKGWSYDRQPGVAADVPPVRSYVRSANAPAPSAWKKDETPA